MSLSSFLLGKRHSKAENDIDGDLDAVLRSSVRPLYPLTPQSVNFVSCLQISTPPTHTDNTAANTGAKRRRDVLKDDFPAPLKRKKSVNTKGQSSPRPPPTTKRESQPKADKEKKGEEVPKRAKTKELSTESSDEEDDAGLEEAYERKVHPATGSSRNEAQPSVSSDSEGETSQLVHETTVVKKDRRSKTRPGRVHHVPPDETKEQRDARTIFLGNVPIQVAKEKVYPKFLHPMASLVSQILSLP